MGVFARKSYDEFTKEIPPKFLGSKKTNDVMRFRKAVGQQLQIYRANQMVTTGKEDDRHNRWKRWFEGVHYRGHEDAKVLNDLDDSGIDDVCRAEKGSKYYPCVYYRLHADITRPQYADAIDQGVFGRVLRESDDEPFIIAPDYPVFEPDPHRVDLHSFPYSGPQKIQVLGRKNEEDTLERFLKGSGFKWLQLAGVAGQGKSRLAWELIQRARDAKCVDGREWEAGFWSLPSGDSCQDSTSEFSKFWLKWTPPKPLLLVIEYIETKSLAVAAALQIFMNRSNEYRQPIRVLIVERQRWDRGGLVGRPAHYRTGNELLEFKQSKNRAGWFDALNQRNNTYDIRDPKYCFETKTSKGVLELRNLNVKHLIKIIRQSYSATKTNITLVE